MYRSSIFVWTTSRPSSQGWSSKKEHPSGEKVGCRTDTWRAYDELTRAWSFPNWRVLFVRLTLRETSGIAQSQIFDSSLFTLWWRSLYGCVYHLLCLCTIRLAGHTLFPFLYLWIHRTPTPTRSLAYRTFLSRKCKTKLAKWNGRWIDGWWIDGSEGQLPVTRTLSNSNLLQTRSKWYSLSGLFLYKFNLENSNLF